MCFFMWSNPVFHIFLWLLLLPMSTAITATWPPSNNCINTTESNPYYKENLIQLLRELNSSSSQKSFHSATVGQPPNQVYGKYLCWTRLAWCPGEISELVDLSSDYRPNQTEVTAWTFNAMIQFSNYSFFGEYKVAHQTTQHARTMQRFTKGITEGESKQQQTLSTLQPPTTAFPSRFL